MINNILTTIICLGMFSNWNGVYYTKSLDIEIFQKVTHDSAFKAWLRDSLPFLTSKLISETGNKEGLKEYQINIGKDSLSMEIIRQFEIEVNPKRINSANDYISGVIDLLKRYEECPNTTFELTFSTLDEYGPSMSQNSVYDDLFEIKDLMLKYMNKVVNYSYIRGRINDKKLTEFADGRKIVTNYDFIWKDGKLIKLKR